MKTSLSILFEILFILYAFVVKILKLHLITFFTVQTFYKRMALLNTVRCILDFNNAQLTEIPLYGKENLENMNNTSILNAIIKYLIKTKRFDVSCCFANVMALRLILLSKLVFSFFFVFVITIIIFLFLGFFFFPVISQHMYLVLVMVNCSVEYANINIKKPQIVHQLFILYFLKNVWHSIFYWLLIVWSLFGAIGRR